MKQLLTQKLQDRSDGGAFRFGLRCGQCGEEWNAKPAAFSKTGVMPVTEEKELVYRVLYRKEQMQARVAALEEAAHHFNLCPVCGRIVCNRCFVICEDLDMCSTCAGYLQERGEKVETEQVG